MSHVHVVAWDLSNPDASILARKALALQGNGWTVSEKPNPKAAVNYFFPYITWSQYYGGWHETPICAYFTHRESNRWPMKQTWWDNAAAAMDLRLTTSRHNLPHLEPYGPTALVSHPPIDREVFQPLGKRELHAQPIIGLVGFVDIKSGRKGEGLVSRLMGDLPQVTFHAVGRNWPCPTKMLPSWRDVAGFYNAIDFYLCLATNEGVPMTVLEALACGTQVIVPSGVGIIDDLPDVKGIWRYEAGDYHSLLATLQKATSTKRAPGRKALRAVTGPYTVEAWCEEHATAIGVLLSTETGTGCMEMEPPVHVDGWRDVAGMYCVAFGEPSRKCVVRCIKSFKAHNPGIPVAFSGVKPVNAGEDIFIQRPDLDIGGRQAKLAVYDAAPAEWEYVLYLDADTETLGDLSGLYRFLAGGWEAVICRDMVRYHVARMMRRPDNEAEYNETMAMLGNGEMLQYNGGVFAFRRCEQTMRFFELWNAEWQKYGARDQGALLRALYTQPVRLWLLGNEWNASDRYPPPAGEIAVLHHTMTARRWGGLIYGRTDSADAWKAVDAWEAERRKGKRK